MVTYFKNHWLRESKNASYIYRLACRALYTVGLAVEVTEYNNGIKGEPYFLPTAPLGDFSKCLHNKCVEIGRQKRIDYFSQGGFYEFGCYTRYIQAHMLEYLCPKQAATHVFDCLELDKAVWDKRGRDNYLKHGEAYLQRDRIFHSWKFELLERLGESTDDYGFFKKLYS
tara:strand:- start:1602 stop:2111 length:510 start_codon:yes stop_codon:yes gene_type:complete